MIKSLLKKDNLIAVLSGVLVGTSYPPFPAWALFFALVPLWILWEKTTDLKKVFITGFITQFTLTMIGFNWVAHTTVEFGHLPGFIGFLVLVAFCCFASLHFPIAGVVAVLLRRKWNLNTTSFLFLLASLTALFEWIYPMIFPWNMAYSLLYSHMKSSQLAEWFGFNLLSYFVFLGNTAFALAAIQFPKKSWSRPVIIFLVGLFAFESVGHWLENRVPKEDGTVRALLIQPNVGNFDKFIAERGQGYQEPVVSKLLSLTEKALAKNPQSQIIIWPETAYPASLDSYFAFHIYPQRLKEFIKQNKIPLITGAYSDDPPGPGAKNYNAVFSINTDGTVSAAYRKYILLAFGEYIPGGEYIPALKSIVPEISDFGRGDGPIVLSLGGIQYAPLICYEGLDPLYVNRFTTLDPQIFVNVTNDSWFGTKLEPFQHMIMTVARTIEQRRSMIRLTNTGITTVADSRGKLLIQGPQEVEWSLAVDVPYHKQTYTTVYNKIAPFITLILILINSITLWGGRYFSRTRLA